MKKKLFIVLALLLCATFVIAQEPIYDYFVYLPWVAGGVAPTLTPPGWPTEWPTPPWRVATPTPTPTITPEA